MPLMSILQCISANNNLVYKEIISLKESLCGYNISFNFLDGKEYNYKFDDIILPNTKKKIPNMGMIHKYGKGILIIEFDIVYPSSLSKQQKEIRPTNQNQSIY